MKKGVCVLGAIFSFLNFGCVSTKQKKDLSQEKAYLMEKNRREANFMAMKFIVNEDGVLEQFNGSDSEVFVPSGVKVIGHAAFRNTLVENVWLPESVVEIRKDAFADCQKIKSITIPSSVLICEEGVFRQCYYLEKVVISGELECIPDNIFSGCSRLKEVQIGYGVKIIGKSFTGCTSLETIEIPDSVEYIADFAFSGCSNLKSITMPTDIEIGRRAFYGTQLQNKEALEALYGESIFF